MVWIELNQVCSHVCSGGLRQQVQALFFVLHLSCPWDLWWSWALLSALVDRVQGLDVIQRGHWRSRDPWPHLCYPWSVPWSHAWLDGCPSVGCGRGPSEKLASPDSSTACFHSGMCLLPAEMWHTLFTESSPHTRPDSFITSSPPACARRLL